MISDDGLSLRCDVLVVGGGPAATWSAVAAAREGARVVLVDKGYCGASGVAATAGVGHWLVPPEEMARAQAMYERARIGGSLTDYRLQSRVLDETWRRLGELQGLGYPASVDDSGRPVLRIGQAPQYLQFMRKLVRRLGVTILDHSPALELLTDSDGVVVGARGIQRQQRRSWEARSGSVVLATGGCTWKSKSLGGDVNTGDGQLFAAEVGAQLSGMEFSSFYGIVPKHTSMDKNGYYGFATFTREDGTVIEGELFGARTPLLRASTQGQVYARFDRAPRELWPVMRSAMPNFFMVLDKLGVDPFRQRFAIDFVLEGTVRGTGGLKLEDDGCSTGVPGLFAAGDTASREKIVGSATGAGAPNAAWAVSSGNWAGRAAALHARGTRARAGKVRAAGSVGLPSTGSASRDLQPRSLLRAVQAEMLPIEKSALRSAAGLSHSRDVLDCLWREARAHLSASSEDVLLARESAAMLAMARWACASALARTETRGMHTRTDFPALDPQQQRRILCGGLDRVWTSVDLEAPDVRLPERLAS